MIVIFLFHYSYFPSIRIGNFPNKLEIFSRNLGIFLSIGIFPSTCLLFFLSRSLESAVQEKNWTVNEVSLECSG
jgi:hypothetical protein